MGSKPTNKVSLMFNNVSRIIVLALGKSLALTILLSVIIYGLGNLFRSNQSWSNSIDSGCRH